MDDAIGVASELISLFKTRIERQDSWLGDWLLEQFKNENRKDDFPNLIRILKSWDVTALWEFCIPFCSLIETEMNENGTGKGYDWGREQYELVEAMFQSVIPCIEQNLEDDNHKQILAYLNIYKGEYMMQTRRFVVAEKLLLKALSLLKELLLVVNINLIAETIGLFDALYRVQNQRADKENYLWDLLNLFQENEKCEDYYLTLKEKLEQK